MPKKNILEEANEITSHNRPADYDKPERNYDHIAAIASTIMKKEISSKEVIVVMMATKLSRENFKHKRDNLTDLAGYARMLSIINGDENDG